MLLLRPNSPRASGKPEARGYYFTKGKTYAFTFLAILATVLAKVVI
jgi:hypothetical protein